MSWASLPMPARAVIIVVVLAQLTLMVIALRRWHRTPDERLALVPRWAWLLIIVFGQLVGPLVFLAAGRRPEPAADPARRPHDAATSHAVRDAVDTLYGQPPAEPPTGPASHR